MESVTMTEAEVRADERKRLAEMIRSNAETIADFAHDKTSTAQLVAHLIRHHAAAPLAGMVADYGRAHGSGAR